MYALTAEREACPTKLLCPVGAFDEATDKVHEMEQNGTWPEGYLPVLECLDTGKRYYQEGDDYTWQEI